MHIIILLSLFVFLFCLFVLSNDDFILFRKNISQERIFNVAFIILGIGLFSSRFLYIIFNFKFNYFNPLIFLAFPYFPGLSLFGGIIGGLAFLILYAKAKKVPFGRMLDIFALSFLFSFSFGLFFNLVFSKKIDLFLDILFLMLHSFLFIISMVIFQKERVKDGNVGLFILFAFSVLAVLIAFLNLNFKLNYSLLKESLLPFLTFIISSYFLIRKFIFRSYRGKKLE